MVKVVKISFKTFRYLYGGLWLKEKLKFNVGREIDMALEHNKTKFDKEYSTQWNKEKDYLESVGIRYIFVKQNDGISTYKYTKTSELFKALESFYIAIKK